MNSIGEPNSDSHPIKAETITEGLEAFKLAGAALSAGVLEAGNLDSLGDGRYNELTSWMFVIL
jgi:hypothetical protein